MKGDRTEDRLNFLKGLLDQLVPPNEKKGIPGAGSVALTYLMDRAGEDAALEEALDALHRSFAGPPDALSPELIGEMEAAQPQAFQALIRHAYMGYYGRSDMRPHFGLSALAVHPGGYEVAPEDPNELDSLVGPVRARGPAYRDA